MIGFAMLSPTPLLMCCMFHNTAFRDMSIGCMSRFNDRMTFACLVLDSPLNRIGGG